MDEHVGFGAVSPPESEMRPDTLPALLPLGVSHVALGVGASAGRLPGRRAAECALYCRLKCSVGGRGFPLPVAGEGGRELIAVVSCGRCGHI